jgi:hypothetical protein
LEKISSSQEQFYKLNENDDNSSDYLNYQISYFNVMESEARGVDDEVHGFPLPSVAWRSAPAMQSDQE